MMATIHTKRALLEIVAIRTPNNKYDKQYYRDIQKYKEALTVAMRENNNAHAELYRNEIKKKRGFLRKMRNQTYVFDVTLKLFPKLKQRVELEFETERGRKEFKKFLKAAEDEALRHCRATLKYKPEAMLFKKLIIANVLGTKEKGIVFADEGTILKAHVKKNMKMLLEGKAPAALRRYVGIELEFCAPIKEEQLAVKLFKNGIHKFGQLKEDGSLRPQGKESSFEIALLLEEGNYKKGLKAVTKVLHEIKAVAKDRRCGLHVHLDMRRRNKELVYNNLVACQYALLAVVDPNRYNNEFCRVVKGRKFPTEFTGQREERYKTINAAAYYKYRTLEVRMHEGSVSFDEVSHWVDLLLKVTNYSKFLKNDVTKLPVLNTRLKLNKKLYNYALERSCSWQIQNNPNARNMREDVADLLARPGRPAAPGLRNHVNEMLIRNPFLDAAQPQAAQDRIVHYQMVNNNVVFGNHDVVAAGAIPQHVGFAINNNIPVPDIAPIVDQAIANDDAAFRRFLDEQLDLVNNPVDFDDDLNEDEDGN